MVFVRDFADVRLKDIPVVGGKNASLGEMLSQLSTLGIRVPGGFAVTVDAYHTFLQANQLDTFIQKQLRDMNVDDVSALKNASSAIRKAILAGTLPEAVIRSVESAYTALSLSKTQSVAVRSSATTEDLASASFAGQQETYLNVSGLPDVVDAIKKVYASLFTERAINYRAHHGFSEAGVGISVGIQKMVRSDLGASGVLFTCDTESGFDQVILITATYGLGELIVQGAVNPDEFVVHKPTCAQGKSAILSRTLGSKKEKMIYAQNNGGDTEIVPVDAAAQKQFCLTDEEMLTLAQQALVIEKHYGKKLDIEWAKDGEDGLMYILQARPETVQSRASSCQLEQYHLNTAQEPIVIGRSVGQKIGQGPVCVIKDPSEMERLKPGDVLVADMTDPDWEPVMKRASAIVTNRGGRTCHAAIVARELGVPAVVGCGDATGVLANETAITVSCAEGETGRVYAGMLPFDIQKTTLANLPALPVKLCLNLANPEQAFQTQFLPNDGVGLVRIEFIISNHIGIHPNAILQPQLISEKERDAILEKTAAYASPKSFYIEKLAEGVATIAAAFYPKPIIVRFSDFKSNEYMHLLGGEHFEPHEENPMIGYRGASRYISGDFQACFALECEAIRRVREEKGLSNTHVMFPFVRTEKEAQRLLTACAAHGLERGKNGLKMMMMCEIPSNVILAETFLRYFDGFSIGSNDLTQLTLGLDRDSGLIADAFDEQDAAVKQLLKRVIDVCREQQKYIGICGQGPSDHPEFAAWLVAAGIEALSLTPDSILSVHLMLGENVCTRRVNAD